MTAIQPLNSGAIQLWARRPDGVTVVAIYHYLVAGLFLAGTLIAALPALIIGLITLANEPDFVIGVLAFGGVAALLLGCTLLSLAVGYGLWTLRSWARHAAIAFAFISLFLIPIGTVTGILTLWYLLRDDVAAQFH